MSREELLQQFPLKRIKPNNGMAVTAEVWDEAHAFHSQQQRFHNLFSHGPGIVTGLEVIASDPADTSVYILPGIAVDSTGQTIVLPQPVAYDIGRELEGLLYLLLSYGESRPRADGANPAEDAPLYVHAEFSIYARSVQPSSPAVELARVRRQAKEDVFIDAADPAYPGANEIDLRFRREIGAAREATVAVCYLGQEGDRKHGRGANYLARALNHSGKFHVVVDDNVPLAPGVEAYTLIYLVGAGSFELSRGQMNGLFNYVQKGRGTVLMESSDAAARSVFTDFLGGVGIKPEPIKAGHRLLTEPYLFAEPPAGFAAPAKADLLVSDGVILSSREYGRLWQGEQKEAAPSRETIRSAMEWGGNIVAYALERRLRAGK